MKRTTKMLSLILAALMLSAPVLSACSDEQEDNTPDTAASSTADTTAAEVTTAAETEPPIPYDYIEKKNYNGKVFTIATPSFVIARRKPSCSAGFLIMRIASTGHSITS